MTKRGKKRPSGPLTKEDYQDALKWLNNRMEGGLSKQGSKKNLTKSELVEKTDNYRQNKKLQDELARKLEQDN